MRSSLSVFYTHTHRALRACGRPPLILTVCINLVIFGPLRDEGFDHFFFSFAQAAAAAQAGASVIQIFVGRLRVMLYVKFVCKLS